LELKKKEEYYKEGSILDINLLSICTVDSCLVGVAMNAL
jgi:hypothetical protein